MLRVAFIILLTSVSMSANAAESREGPDLKTTLKWIENMVNKYCVASKNNPITCRANISGQVFTYTKKGKEENQDRYTRNDKPMLRYDKTWKLDLRNLSGARNYENLEILSNNKQVELINNSEEIDDEHNVSNQGSDSGYVDRIRIKFADKAKQEKVVKAFAHVYELLVKGSPESKANDENLF